MNLILICFLYLTPIDTIPIKYITYQTDPIWKDGYFVANVTNMTDIYIIFDEPTLWLNSKKEAIEKPKKYHLK